MLDCIIILVSMCMRALSCRIRVRKEKILPLIEDAVAFVMDNKYQAIPVLD